MYVNVYVGQIVDLGAVRTTSMLDILCKACVLQSGQSVEFAALCRNSLQSVLQSDQSVECAALCRISLYLSKLRGYMQ